MTVEEEIRAKLSTGYSPVQLVEQGFRKSTVYKVHATTRAYQMPVGNRAWTVHDANFLNARYLPGGRFSVAFTLRNDSPLDLYAYKVGIKAEWMPPHTWHAQEIKELVKPGTQRWINFPLSIPPQTPLGEYDILFGVEGQYLPVNTAQPLQVEWSEPAILQVKRPSQGLTIFLSHSTKDMHLVRQLEKRLDEDGIQVIIGEDKLQPGVFLAEKFQRLIQESNLVVALLTDDAIRSQWVAQEISYAIQINKPRILLKEESATLDPSLSTREWIKFNRSDDFRLIYEKLSDALQIIRANNPGILPLLLVAGIVTLIAAAIADS